MALTPRIRLPSASRELARPVGRVARSVAGPLLRTRSLRGAVDGRTVMVTGASSGIGRAAAVEIARAGGTVLLVARSTARLKDTAREIEASHGLAEVYRADLSAERSIDELLERVLPEHPTIDVLVNNAGRSIRRSLALSYERFHDFERTMQLNYFAAVRLTLALLPSMVARGEGHVIGISSIGVLVNAPRFSAYVASKAALEGFTRCAAAEFADKGVAFTVINMPLVRTPMIAPTRMYEKMPTIGAEDAADLIAEAIIRRPQRLATRLGLFVQWVSLLAPKLGALTMSTAYRMFPESATTDSAEARPTREALAFAQLLRGVHW